MLRRLPILVGVAAVILLAITPAAVSQTGPLLIQNPGAEASPGVSCNASTGFRAPAGWEVTSGHLTAYRNDCSDPSAIVAGIVDDQFFSGGDAGDSKASQYVDLSAARTAIDAGTVQATLSALLGGYKDQGDHASVQVIFRDEAGRPLGTGVQIGPVTATERGNQSKLLSRSATGAVPRLSREAQIVLTAVKLAGAVWNDGAADNISLTLEYSPPKQPATPKAAARLSLTLFQKRFAVAQATFIASCSGLSRNNVFRCTVKNRAVVSICNRDGFKHRPFSFSASPNGFKAVVLLPGKCFERRFVNPTRSPISVKIFDDIHSQERLELRVMPA